MSRRLGIAFALAAAVLCLGGPAGAAPRLRLDRVVVEPSWFPGFSRARLYVSAVRLEGSVLPVSGDDAWEIELDGRRRRIPLIAGYFGQTHGELAIAIVVETAFDYRDVLDRIKRATEGFVSELPDTARLTIIGYAAEASGGHKLEASRAAARHDIAALEPALAPGPPVLLRATERAVRTLRRAEPQVPGATLRKIIIIVSDGRDEDPKPARYRELGERAARHGIRIHTIAFSPVDNRRPLLGLGELSKRSLGTFRWVRDPTGFGSHFRNIKSELSRQYVLTMFARPETIAKRRIRVIHGELTSNEVRVPDPSCGAESCEQPAYCSGGACIAYDLSGGLGFLGWVGIIAGVLAGGFAVLLAIGFILTRRRERAAAKVPAPPAKGAPIKPTGPVSAIQPVAPPPAAQPAARPSAIQPAAQPGARPSAAHPAVASAGPTLLILSGPRQGQRLPLRHGFTVGKARGADLELSADPFASQDHAQILIDAAHNVTVVDRQSTNGTFVNGVRITEMRLSHGMSIRFGQTEARFLAH